MRRGALHNALKEKGFNKLALGHHADDAIETLFLSMLYEGRFKTLPPKSYLTRKKIYVIRPFLYLDEREIEKAVDKFNIPPIVKKIHAMWIKKLKGRKFTNYLQTSTRKFLGLGIES